MSKSKKKLSSAEMEKLQRQIGKELEEKNFGSAEEINKYLEEKYVGKKISFDDTKLSPKDKAMDLIYDAWEIDSPDEKILLAEKALKLDKDCADAYNLLAQVKAKTPMESLELYAKGIETGKKSIGKNFEELKGHFWGFHETRPFMRAMSGYSNVLWEMEEKNKAIEIMKEMLQLNPNDNQGVRHSLITRLLILDKLLEAEKLYKDYEDDSSAEWRYSKAYLYFNKRSKEPYANKALKEAMQYNPYVPLYLFDLIDMPDELPEYVGSGDKNEAICYVYEAMELWAESKKTLIWFVDMHRKMKDDLDKLIKKREEENKERFGDRFDEE